MNKKTVILSLPEDVLFEIIPSHLERGTLEDKLKLKLAIGLFASKDISLKKAAELAGKSLVDFISILSQFNISSDGYTGEMYKDDLKYMPYYKVQKEEY